jgi:hypothetical protein
MSPKRKTNGILWLELFVVLVILTGYALYTTGHFENPFSVFGFRGFSDARNTFIPRGNISVNDQTGIFLSQLGDVLFNVWFICAMTAALIIVQKLGGFVVSLVKRWRSSAASQAEE